MNTAMTHAHRFHVKHLPHATGKQSPLTKAGAAVLIVAVALFDGVLFGRS